MFSVMLLMNPMNSAKSKSAHNPQQEESKSKPFKVVMNLEYTESSLRKVLERFQYTMKIAMNSRKQKPMILMK